MQAALEERVTETEMAKRNDVSVKIDAKVASMAKIVAEFEGKSAAQYMSDVLRPIVEKDLERHSRKYLKAKGQTPES